MKMSQKEELRILRSVLWKIGNGLMGVEAKGKSEVLTATLSEIRYGYCYGQSNSNEGDSYNDTENKRIRSLQKLDKI